MGGKPSNFNQMNPMATDRKSRVEDQGTREQDKQAVASSQHPEDAMIPESHENPEQAELRAMRQQRDKE